MLIFKIIKRTVWVKDWIDMWNKWLSLWSAGDELHRELFSWTARENCLEKGPQQNIERFLKISREPSSGKMRTEQNESRLENFSSWTVVSLRHCWFDCQFFVFSTPWHPFPQNTPSRQLRFFFFISLFFIYISGLKKMSHLCTHPSQCQVLSYTQLFWFVVLVEM